MILLRQKEYSSYGFMDRMKGKPEQDLLNKIKNFEKNCRPTADSNFRDVPEDFSKWVSFLHKEDIKNISRLSLNPEYYIMGYKDIDKYSENQIVIAKTYSTSGGDFCLVYDPDTEDYKVLRKTSGLQFLSKAVNKLFKEEGKIYYETKSLLSGILWIKNNVRTTYC